MGSDGYDSIETCFYVDLRDEVPYVEKKDKLPL